MKIANYGYKNPNGDIFWSYGKPWTREEAIEHAFEAERIADGLTPAQRNTVIQIVGCADESEGPSWVTRIHSPLRKAGLAVRKMQPYSTARPTPLGRRVAAVLRARKDIFAREIIGETRSELKEINHENR